MWDEKGKKIGFEVRNGVLENGLPFWKERMIHRIFECAACMVYGPV